MNLRVGVLTQGAARFVLIGADVIPAERTEEESDCFIPLALCHSILSMFNHEFGRTRHQALLLQETLMKLQTPRCLLRLNTGGGLCKLCHLANAQTRRPHAVSQL